MIISINNFILKLSILILLIISEGGGLSFLFNFFFELSVGGLLIENGWTETTKLIIILGSIAVLLMVDMERLIFPKLFGGRVCGTFFQTNAHLPLLNLMVALGGLCLVSSSN